MAKASEADLEMAMELCGAIDALMGWCPAVPEPVQRVDEGEDVEHFDCDDGEQCIRVLGHLLDVAGRASLLRVVWGCAVMLDPRNACVDPDADTIEHHPDTKAGKSAKEAKPLEEWNEEVGAVLWWRFPVDEAPYVGSPLCDDWPGYHTHWTPVIVPAPRRDEVAAA